MTGNVKSRNGIATTWQRRKLILEGGVDGGRPPRAPESIRRNRVVTLMTDAEFEKLTKVAEEKEESVSALVHQIVSRYLKRRS